MGASLAGALAILLWPIRRILRLRSRALPFDGREAETRFVLERFLEAPALGRATPCLVIWGPNGIGKSHLLSYLEWRLAAGALRFWRRRTWLPLRLILHPGEGLAAGLVRALPGTIDVTDLRALAPAELGDQFLLRCNPGTVVLVDEVVTDMKSHYRHFTHCGEPKAQRRVAPKHNPLIAVAKGKLEGRVHRCSHWSSQQGRGLLKSMSSRRIRGSRTFCSASGVFS